MRVIAGKARSIRLKTVEGMETRPTTDRIKETLFNMLQPYLADCRFLDLFSGSGGIGIEALSRGAAHCVFVEQQRKAVACIMENLKVTHLQNDATVLSMDAIAAVKKLDAANRLEQEKTGKSQVFDIIFMDPPYNQELEFKVLEALLDTSLIDTYTTIVIEASLETSWEKLEALGYAIIKEKRYKTNQHVFIRKGE